MHCNDTHQPFRQLWASDVLGTRFILLSLPHWLPAGTQLVIILGPRSEEKREPQGIMRRGRSRLVEGARVWVWVGLFMQSGIHVNHLIGNGRLREIGPWQETGLTWFSNPFNIFFLFFILLHHREVTYRNNYLIYINIFLIYSRVHIIFVLEVSIILELIYYF